MTPLDAIRAVFASDLKGAQRMVAVVAASHVNADGEFWCSESHVASEAGIAPRSARRAIAALVESKVLHNTGRSTRYGCLIRALNLDALPRTQCPPDTQSPRTHSPPTPDTQSPPGGTHGPPTPDTVSPKEVKRRSVEEVTEEVTLPAVVKPRHSMAVGLVWERYQHHHPSLKRKPAKKEVDRIKGALDDCKRMGLFAPTSELMRLIDWIHTAPDAAFWQGDNERRKKYLGIHTILKLDKLGDRIDSSNAWDAAGRPMTAEAAPKAGTPLSLLARIREQRQPQHVEIEVIDGES